MRSNKFPVLDPFSDICPPLKEVVLPMETLSLASSFPEELDSFRNVTYVSEVEESKGDVEDDWEMYIHLKIFISWVFVSLIEIF